MSRVIDDNANEIDRTREVIIDNREQNVGDFLRKKITSGSDLSIVSAFFTIYAYEALRDELENTRQVRFLYGEPTATEVPDPGEEVRKSFGLNDDGGMELKQALVQKPLARDCAAWIERQVEIKTIKRANFLHGKLYHVDRDREGDSVALVGSSNFTRRGLGLGRVPNIELNVDVNNWQDRNMLLSWFNELWHDNELTVNVKDTVLAALRRLSKPYPPEFVFYKTLFHVFEKWLERHEEQDGQVADIKLKETKIWNTLYRFQKDGAISAINRLRRHNGCIIADSVGLGKTFTALAVIKFFELWDNKKVLVLCPKRLEENWIRFTSWAGLRNNPFEDDSLRYVVRAHTDLSRYEGQARGIDLAKFNWTGFDLIVIDESHNFRNEGRDQRDEKGNLIRHNRYNRLLEKVLKGGTNRTKVLMLSATPVNTSLRDLRNQIYLMTEKRQDAFRKTLGISSIERMFGTAQKAFQQWETANPIGKSRNKSDLLNSLGVEFLSLLDAVSLARSRTHLRRFYADTLKDIGGFPRRAKPRNLHPVTDTKGALSYDEIHRRIENFRMAVYTPSQYLKDTSKLDAEKAKLNFDQRDRERFLIGMMRVNLLKRLESSVHAYTLTTSRIIDKLDANLRLIEQWRTHNTQEVLDFRPDEDEEDEEFAIGKGRQYRLDELDVDQWEKDLNEDRTVFVELYNQSKQVIVERDDKLTTLKQELRRKAEEAPLDNDDKLNRKALVFTSFADTARYLYTNLEGWVRENLGLHIALVTGGNDNKSTVGTSQTIDILSRFAPKAQEVDTVVEHEIDFLIATDCLSEGQNLQDCDLVINYDIHWNPVRLMQRFGRIDRLGSRNREVAMTNFWPTAKLESYLNLKNRVEARMALVDATATGLDDLLAQETDSTSEQKTSEMELTFRDHQLSRMAKEILDFEEIEDSVSLSDLTLDDFVADLLNYLQENRKALEAAPLGIHSIVAEGITTNQDPVHPGVIFCLRYDEEPAAKTPNRIWPYFLVYIQEDGKVRYTFQQVPQCLKLFQALIVDQPNTNKLLEDVFDDETQHGRNMKKYDTILEVALSNIASTFRNAELNALKNSGDAVLTKKTRESDQYDHFTLVTWLVIATE